MTSEVSDAGSGGLAIKHQFVLNAIGQEVERRQPLAPGTGAAGSSNVATTTVTIYYSSGAGGHLDRAVFELAIHDERAIVTENVPDFMALANEAIAAGKPLQAPPFRSNLYVSN